MNAALTAEEWEHVFPDGSKRGPWVDRGTKWGALISRDGSLCAGGTIPNTDERHALAALALYAQSFGFRREDVGLLRDAATGKAYLADNIELSDLADRIEALLPPE
jgi:hypothetical protein